MEEVDGSNIEYRDASPMYLPMYLLGQVLEAEKYINSFYCAEVNYTPTKDNFTKNDISAYNLDKYELIFINSHGDGNNFEVFSKQEDWDQGENPKSTVNSSELAALYNDKTKRSKLFVMNCCKNCQEQFIDGWFSKIQTKCLLGWDGESSMFYGSMYFKRFFGVIAEMWEKATKTSIENAIYASTNPPLPFPNWGGLPPLNYRGKIGDDNLMPYE
ncbi:MAG: hypothetical protein PHQ23_07970 [Candidatus Wallbacteria bacterium]|nr:hypothetical protein [Candidatus Wallbacteria bacterium]